MVIDDGQGKELQDEDGHRKGIETLVLIAKAAAKFNIKYLTLFSFSKENWKRDPSEISNLMDLMESFESEYLDEIILNNIRVTVIGDIDTLAKPQKKIIKMVQERTCGNTGMQLIAAFNYSGRDEIIRAVKKIVNDVQLAKISADMINNDLLGNYLDTANIPDPDLIIRTSGEMRLSNFCYGNAHTQNLYLQIPFGLILLLTISIMHCNSIRNEREDMGEIPLMRGCELDYGY